MNKNIMLNVINVFKRLILAHTLFLIFMSIFRGVFFFYYSPLNSLNGFFLDILKGFFLGFRIDLTVVGYIQILPTIVLIILYYLKNSSFLHFFNKFLIYYLFICYVLVSLFLCCDFAFYSYFKEHINILFFGLIDDDTKALLITFWENYSVLFILFAFFVYLMGLLFLLKKIFSIKDKPYKFFLYLKFPILIFLIILILNFLAVRGTFGMYPLGKMIPDVSINRFINKIAPNGMRSFVSAYGYRKKYLHQNYDLIKATGFHNNIEKAFEIYKNSKDINKKNLFENITYKTHKIDDKKYNVVVIMVESFGMPILKYESKGFDILRRLKKHFNEDIVMTNFISSGDGTISSLESLLLNIPHRPGSFAFSQSIYKQTPFTYGPAFLYDKAGYETTFIYGGDLTWRDLGSFVKHQGYKHVEGKIDIFKGLKNKDKAKKDYFHPWGIYDEYLMDHILKKLENSHKKQFIVALTTNNHPPYNIPKGYKREPLIFNKNLRKHLTGDFDLLKKRFASYAYAMDQVGAFLDKFKASKYKDNTIVVITADNNTIDGIMKYDKNKIFNSKNIPLYFYLPKTLRKKLVIDTKVAGSHKDIFPTLYNLTLKNQKYISIGTNLFDKEQKHYGFNGSLVVNSKNKAKKFKNFSIKNEPMLQYYKASLAITQYLIKSEYNKNKGKLK